MSNGQFQDSADHLLRDFQLWLQQNQGSDQAFYFDEGPPAVIPAADAGTEAESPAPMAPTRLTKNQLVPLPNLIASGDPFLQECNQFTEQAVALIQQQKSAGVTELSADPLVVQCGGQIEAMSHLREMVVPCQGCALHQSRTTTVFGAGNPNAAIVFVGEAPGRDEDLQGEPFVGQSGQLLTKILGAIGLDRDEIFICNILKCRPPGNRDPLPNEVVACEAHLKRQLAILQPLLICCLGRVAAQTLLGSEASLGSLRRSVHFYQGIPVMATYHPAALLRNSSWKKDTWNDVRKLRALHDVLIRERT